MKRFGAKLGKEDPGDYQPVMRVLCYEDRLRELGLFRLEKRGLLARHLNHAAKIAAVGCEPCGRVA